MAETIFAGVSAAYRYDGASNFADTVGDMEEGDVFVIDTAVAKADLDGTIKLREVVTGDLAFVAGEKGLGNKNP